MPDTKLVSFGSIVSRSTAMHRTFEILKRAAPYPATVLLIGESGTGKRLAAEAVHSRSSRKDHDWVTFDCSSVPESLLESRLFGHVAGAFTDAIDDRTGVFELASGSTLFISELANTTPAVQVRFLRVLQEGVVQRLGENSERPVDVRLIVSAPTDLRTRVADGRFREDLYYRLNVIEAELPALRERPEDIELLVSEFTREFEIDLGIPSKPFNAAAIGALRGHSWPGNVRELRNVVQRCLVLADGDEIGTNDLPESVEPAANEPTFPVLLDSEDLSVKRWTRELEKQLIRKALEKTDGNRTHAAKLLELSHRALLYKLKDYFPDGI